MWGERSVPEVRGGAARAADEDCTVVLAWGRLEEGDDPLVFAEDHDKTVIGEDWDGDQRALSCGNTQVVRASREHRASLRTSAWGRFADRWGAALGDRSTSELCRSERENPIS